MSENEGWNCLNIGPLRALEDLESLILKNLGIVDLGGLEGKKLRILALVDLPKLTYLSKLINFPQIDSLILINTGIKDFSVLKETNIKNIYFGEFEFNANIEETLSNLNTLKSINSVPVHEWRKIPHYKKSRLLKYKIDPKVGVEFKVSLGNSLYIFYIN